MDWSLLEKNKEIFRFFSLIIRFRKAHPVLRNRYHFQNRDYASSGFPDISFHGVHAWNCDFSETSRVLAFMLCGKHARQASIEDDYIYVAMNMYWEALNFEIPEPPTGKKWYVAANTGMNYPEDIHETDEEPELENREQTIIGARSILVLIGK
jgi:glycogen operon protein